MPVKYLLCLLLVVLSVSVLAQDIACPELEQAALAETGLWCNALEPGQLCYGNSLVQIAARSGTLEFNVPGNRVSLADVRSITTITGSNLWGVAYAEVEAYPITGWTPAPAALIAMGSTTLIDTGTELNFPAVLTLEITEVDGANIRRYPNTAAGVVGSVFKGDLVKVIGRLADSSWLHVQTPRGLSGWLSAVTVEADVSGLPVVTEETAESPLLSRPFAAFQFTSGMNDTRCDGVPESGVLIQTPDTETAYRFDINGVYIELAGTMFLQAMPDTFFILHIVEGEALARVQNASLSIGAGFESVILMSQSEDGILRPAGAPARPRAYAHEKLLPLPMRLLPRLAYVVFDLRTIIRPRPTSGDSPLAGVLVSDPCVVTVGSDGVNLRGGPGTDFPVRGVINFRESALPVGRTTGTDGNNWWQLSQDVWISGTVTVTGGNCAAVPIVEAPILPPPAAAQP